MENLGPRRAKYMNVLIQKSSSVNGSLSGRGLAHRRLNPEQSVGLAADVATGQRRFEPSLAQLSSLFGVSITRLRRELKARAAAAQKQADKPKEPEPELEIVNSIEGLVREWNAATASDREWFARVVGVDALWDVIARIIR